MVRREMTSDKRVGRSTMKTPRLVSVQIRVSVLFFIVGAIGTVVGQPFVMQIVEAGMWTTVVSWVLSSLVGFAISGSFAVLVFIYACLRA